MYGDLENSVNGKTLIFYGVDDPKGEGKIIKRFEEEGISVVSWNKLFIPSYEYSEDEMKTAIEEQNIETIILIKLDDTSSYAQSNTDSSYSSWTTASNPSATRGKELGEVALVFKIYGKHDNYDKPVALINGDAKNRWGSLGSQASVTLTIVNRVIDSMIEKKAFE